MRRDVVVGMGLLAVGLLWAGGCKQSNSDYCCTVASACDGMGLQECSDPSKSFCDNFGSYGGTGRTCIAPPGQVCSGPSDCTDPALPVCVDRICSQCGANGDCDASAPVCDETSHSCGACQNDDDCAGFAERGICDGGECIGCRDQSDCTAATAPVCDTADQMCRGCQKGSECSSDVCSVGDGACVAEDDVLYVASGGDDGGSCTKSAPCATITAALGKVSGSRTWIDVAAGTYAENLSISSDVNIVGQEGTVLTISEAGPLVGISGGARVLLEGFQIRDATGTQGHGVQCTAASSTPTVQVVDMMIGPNAQTGIQSTGCTLTVSGSTFSGNAGGGVSSSGGSVEVSGSTFSGNAGGGLSLQNMTQFRVINNFIVENGTITGNLGGVYLDGATGSRFEHNTLTLNQIKPTSLNAAGVTCTGALPLQNNIIYGNATDTDDQVNGDCTHASSLIGPKAVVGEGNLSDAPEFVDPGKEDFHLQATSPGVDVAADSDVKVDIDGDARPQGPASDIGADEVVK